MKQNREKCVLYQKHLQTLHIMKDTPLMSH